MRKIISSFVAIAMLLAILPVFAAEDQSTVYVRPTDINGNMNISLELSDDYIGHEVFVYIFNPGTTLDNLTSESQVENSKLFQYSGQKTYQKGGVTFSFKMNTDRVNATIEPNYKVYAITDDEKSLTFNFTYSDRGVKESMLTAINGRSVDASYADQIYKAFSLQYIDLYGRAGNTLTATKLNTLAKNAVTVEGVETLFADAILLAAANKGVITLSDLNKYNQYLNISNEFTAEYANLRQSGIDILQSDINADLTDMAALDLQIKKAIMTAAVYGNVVEGSGALAKVVAAHESFFQANGLKLEQFNKASKDTIGKKILSGTRLKFDDMIKSINEELNDTDPIPHPGGGGGGSSSSGSSPAVVGTVVENSQNNGKVSDFEDLDQVPWAADGIKRLYKSGVISGKEYGKFAPNDSITREEFVQIINGTFSLQKGNQSIGFSDVATDSWSYNAIITAASCGIVTGDGAKFYPSNLITREDMAAILVRVLNHKGVHPSIATYNMPFDDTDEISSYAQESINILYQNKVVSGKDNNKFEPKANATRAEAVKMICGALDLI